MKRLSLAAFLSMLLVLCLLAAAGPALAGSPFGGTPPGSQWGGHEINAKFTYVKDDPVDGAVVFACVASDPRVSGELRVYVEGSEPTPDGNVMVWGSYDLINDGGSWHCAYWWQLLGKNALLEGPAQAMTFNAVATGVGANYEGLSFLSSNHSGGGSMAPWILKGWIY